MCHVLAVVCSGPRHMIISSILHQCLISTPQKALSEASLQLPAYIVRPWCLSWVLLTHHSLVIVSGSLRYTELMVCLGELNDVFVLVWRRRVLRQV